MANRGAWAKSKIGGMVLETKSGTVATLPFNL